MRVCNRDPGIKRVDFIGYDCLTADTPAELLSRHATGYECRLIDWQDFRREQLSGRDTDLLVIAAPPDATDAEVFFNSLSETSGLKPVLAIVSPNASLPLLQSIFRVADDFLVSPVRPCDLNGRVARVLGLGRRDTADIYLDLIAETGMSQLVGTDPRFRSAIEKLPIIARANATVLITGETGTGKEMCARAIHFLSSRQGFPFIPVDCGAVPDHLIENELFGHVRGAYTDARQDQKGLAAVAENGTLFLDEVDSLSEAAQAKLLRFLQEHTFKPLGAERAVKANVNVIAATNRNLEVCMREGRFRSDLFFRLNVLRVDLPPLRERRGDIEVLARHFIHELTGQSRAGARSLSPAALRKLMLYDWPGNVRELYNTVHRAVLLTEDKVIPAVDLPIETHAARASEVGLLRHDKARVAEDFERRCVERLLRKHLGNVTHAAQEAGKDRRAFGRLIKKYNISKN
jgi:DNA-binding NtrC family response regulator